MTHIKILVKTLCTNCTSIEPGQPEPGGLLEEVLIGTGEEGEHDGGPHDGDHPPRTHKQQLNAIPVEESDLKKWRSIHCYNEM